MSTWDTDGVYKYLSGELYNNDAEIYEIDEISYSNQIELLFFFIYIIVLFILFMFIICGIIHCLFNSICQKCCKREDNFRFNYMFIFTIYCWEWICDILFISFMFVNNYNNYTLINNINNRYTIILIISISSISFTYILNLLIGFRMIYILYKHNNNIYNWFHSSYFNSFLFIFLSFITFNCYITVPLFNSNLFGLSLFSMTISKYDINYILGKKSFNLCTHLLPLLLIRIIYLLLIQTFNILILSSFIPICLSFCITTWYLCHARSSRYYHNRYLSRNKLKCCFEVSSPSLSKMKHCGLTKHLQSRFTKLFNIDKNEIELFKPIDLCDKISPRFEIRFIIRSNQETLERIQHEFSQFAQNGQLSKAVSQVFNVDLVHISKQSEDIIKNPHLLWGSKSSVHVYDDIAGNNNNNNNNNHNQIDNIIRYPFYDNNNNNQPTNTNDNNIYYDGGGGDGGGGELKNVNIDADNHNNNKNHKSSNNSYHSLKSRSSTSFNHPPINAETYKQEMADITEEEDDENEQLFNIYRHSKNNNEHNNGHNVAHDDNMADASSVTLQDETNTTTTTQPLPTRIEPPKTEKKKKKKKKKKKIKQEINMTRLDTRNEDNADIEEKHDELIIVTPGGTPSRIKNKSKHKHVTTPSFSISAMDNNGHNGHHVNGSLGLIIDSPPPTTVHNESHNESHHECNSNAASVSNFTSPSNIPISLLQAVVPSYNNINNNIVNNNTICIEQQSSPLQLDTTIPISHQTKSVMVDPIDVQEALSLQSKKSIPLSVCIIYYNE